MINDYSNYSLGDFDKYDCLKLSNLFYLVLLFVLRGYLVWIMSITNMKDSIATIQWVYPNTNSFYLSLISGSIGLIVIIIVTLRRPDAGSWIKKLWPYSRILLLSALLFDLSINFFAYFYWQISSMLWLSCQTAVVIGLVTLCYRSKRMKINLIEFPQKLPE